MTTITAPSPTIYELRGWDLSELLPAPSEAEIARRFAELEAALAQFEQSRESLAPGSARISPEQLLAMVRRYEAISEQTSVLSNYGSLWFNSDTGNQEAITFRNRVRQAVTAATNRTLFFTLWWKSLPEEEAQALLQSVPPMPQLPTEPAAHAASAAHAAPAASAAHVAAAAPATSGAAPAAQAQQIADYRHFLLELRRFSPYTLDEKSEQIINIKDENGIGAVTTLYSMLTSRMEFTLEVDGETKRLTRDALTSYAFSTQPELRAAAYRELYRVFSHDATILGQIYVNVVRDWHEEAVGLRGYPSAIAVRNTDNDVPDRAVDVLLEVARANAPVFQRYFRLKAGWLGLERLRRYDLYAPLASSERKIPYGEAVRSVLDTFGEFDTGFAGLAERVLAKHHLDGEIRKGKRGGAFCATVGPRFTPWVLVNYTGRVRDVATLAHELGHAVHSMLAEHHSLLTQHASLPLAETASVFAEMLITDRLLREESDPLARRELLAAAVDDVYATVLRQSYFVRFELEAHQAILAGRSVEDLNEIYLAELAEQFGGSVLVAPEFRYEWMSIPHIYHTPFYCYAYSFGQLLVLALYRRYQEQGAAFKPGYLRLLAYGGSARPEAILAEMGIDMTDRSFWQGGFELVRQRIDELAAIRI
ncbi:MAG TPA: M3 family oligoendopeptidase [Thermoanaerobaculia bacterium]|nr:M3 family oligoendopeptidase [Thermoanaerobaculia bacterium]